MSHTDDSSPPLSSISSVPRASPLPSSSTDSFSSIGITNSHPQGRSYPLSPIRSFPSSSLPHSSSINSVPSPNTPSSPPPPAHTTLPAPTEPDALKFPDVVSSSATPRHSDPFANSDYFRQIRHTWQRPSLIPPHYYTKNKLAPVDPSKAQNEIEVPRLRCLTCITSHESSKCEPSSFIPGFPCVPCKVKNNSDCTFATPILDLLFAAGSTNPLASNDHGLRARLQHVNALHSKFAAAVREAEINYIEYQLTTLSLARDVSTDRGHMRVTTPPGEPGYGLNIMDVRRLLEHLHPTGRKTASRINEIHGILLQIGRRGNFDVPPQDVSYEELEDDGQQE